jgi:hypothetical protein
VRFVVLVITRCFVSSSELEITELHFKKFQETLQPTTRVFARFNYFYLISKKLSFLGQLYTVVGAKCYHLVVINLSKINTLCPIEVTYYYHLANAITYSLYQSDHVKLLKLYLWIVLLNQNSCLAGSILIYYLQSLFCFKCDRSY